MLQLPIAIGSSLRICAALLAIRWRFRRNRCRTLTIVSSLRPPGSSTATREDRISVLQSQLLEVGSDVQKISGALRTGCPIGQPHFHADCAFDLVDYSVQRPL